MPLPMPRIPDSSIDAGDPLGILGIGSGIIFKDPALVVGQLNHIAPYSIPSPCGAVFLRDPIPSGY